jgi:hypothetical protein
MIYLLPAARLFFTMSSMKSRLRSLNERGLLNALLLPLIVVVLLLAGAVGFAFWAYGGRQDYKDNVDAKVNVAVAAAVKAEDTKKAAAYAEADKYPLKTYSGPSAYGSLQVQYPKTWSAYIIELATGDPSVDGYFQPNFVPNTQSSSSTYALHVRVTTQSYATVVQNLQGFVQTGKTTATPFAFSKVPNAIGTSFDGQIGENKQGSLIVVPLRANALEVSTEAAQYADDFNKNILPNLSFSP